MGGWQPRCEEHHSYSTHHIPSDCLLNMLAEGVRDVYMFYNKVTVLNRSSIYLIKDLRLGIWNMSVYLRSIDLC